MINITKNFALDKVLLLMACECEEKAGQNCPKGKRFTLVGSILPRIGDLVSILANNRRQEMQEGWHCSVSARIGTIRPRIKRGKLFILLSQNLGCTTWRIGKAKAKKVGACLALYRISLKPTRRSISDFKVDFQILQEFKTKEAVGVWGKCPFPVRQHLIIISLIGMNTWYLSQIKASTQH